MAAAKRTFTFLGTGTSVGVPMIGCRCPVCTSSNRRNHRYRCSVLMRLPAGNLLIDTPPELRLQLLREKVSLVHAVLYTHYHADHLHGLDDLRPIPKNLGHAVPLYCTREVETKIRTSFPYAFVEGADELPTGYLPKLSFERITEDPFEVLEEEVTPIALEHSVFDVFGFRVRDVAYCTDVNTIPERSWPRLEGLRVLVLDALRNRPHPGHLSLDQAVDVIRRVKPKHAYLTHMSHELDHDATNRMLPDGIELAYDGLSFDF